MTDINVILSLVKKYPELSLNWNCISKNKNLMMEFVEKHID